MKTIYPFDQPVMDGAQSIARRAKSPFLVSVLTGVLGLVLAGQATAQTFTVLHSFGALDHGSNIDGVFPTGELILSSNALYGTTLGNDFFIPANVFTINADGTGFTTLHSLGGWYRAGVSLLLGGTLYGTSLSGGNVGNGTVFALNVDGTGFAVLHSFTAYSGLTNSDGANPQGSLVPSGNTLYGTTAQGGPQQGGTVFALHTDGTGFAILHSFGINPGEAANPEGGLVLSGNALYGTTASGGSGDNGTVFKLNTDGTGFAILHSFTADSIDSSGAYTNSDGADPSALVLSGGRLCGTASSGGSSGSGTLFAVNVDGSGFKILHSFVAGSGPWYSLTNSDGGGPNALILSGRRLYGTTESGGSSGNGTVFSVNTDGTSFTTLHSFAAFQTNIYTNSEGGHPSSGLVLSDNTLYGTATDFGIFGGGTIFSIALPANPPQLTITSVGANVVLSWPTNFTAFTLQSTANLSSPVWTTNLPASVVVNGLNTVTNLISGTQQFFRLSQ
jgi:uncharacterized repeat protein (TIGR03803 family)